MPDFNAIKAQVNESREALNSEKKKVFLAREKIQRVKRIKGQILRSKGKNSEQYRILEENERDLKQSLASRKQRLSGLLQNHSGLYEAFGQFTDPRQNLEQFSNEYPILLFPLRLETRFKKITENGVVKHQLWVRVFPDECSVDTFDDVPSEAEIIKVQNYWIDLWKTGVASAPDLQPFVINKNKGAWKALMGNHNPGRAYWLTQIYGPLNESDIPTRMNESDLIWIIAAENPPTSANQSAIITYWRSFFAAAGDPTKLQTAFDALKTTLAADDATTASVIREFTPVNISDPPADEAGEVIVAFLNFPPAEDVDAKLNSWSGAARVTTLPERLVLIGLEKDNPTPVINQLGNPIPDPLIVGPDPGEDIDEVLKTVHGDSFEDLPDEEKASKYMEYLSAQSETSWLFDFEEAINIGLGFKVDLQEHQYENGLQKLYVLGVRLSADENEAQKLLENLLKNHHFGDTGFSILPQGTPTNNTEDSASSYSEREDADEAFDRYFSTTPPEDPSDDALKCDGKWLAELLGISTIDSTLKLSEYYYHKDQCESRAMNTALWNATLGYFMESMLTPVFDDDQIEFTRWFLINHVSGRGRIPAIRIGDQPYGILPVSTVSSLPWMKDRNSSFAEIYSHQFPFFQKLSVLLSKIRETWDDLLEAVAYVGKNGEDGHQIILQALGLHASSVEFDQRYAESFEQLYNTSILTGINPGSLSVWTEIFYKLGGILLLQQLGYAHDFEANPQIPILEKFFFTKENDVNRPLIDDQPLSEEKKIRAYTDPGENYIEWLIEQALKDHRNLKDQKGFTDDKAPNALLYGMLRHALNLEYSNSGLRLYQQAGIMNAASVSEARIDAPFIGISSEPQAFESKWDYLYRREPQISHSNDLLVDHITEKLKAAVPTAGLEHLNELIDALDHLKDRPTASLERAFVEHLDCCTYRLDAWLLGLVNLQLYHMRYGTTEAPKQGIYLGAYGWVEDLKPDHKQFEPVEFTDDELRNTFNPDGTLTINRDDTNYGYIHAPSISHAQTASVLRNAYKSTASEENAEIYKINLSSERVRLALSMVEGLQQGQSLGALLGYQLERGLHDNTNLELDVFIYELRKIFPLRSNRQQGTQISEDRVTENDDESTRYPEEEAEFEEENAVTKIEARNVVDGLALLEHIKTNGQENYPFGIPVGKGPGKLMAAPGPEGDAIDAEVQRLMNIRDAVADLAMAESVHQVVQGNYERASGALDTYSKGNYPQTPDVIQSPGSGVTLNHRFGIHLQSGIDPATASTPRSQAEPALNHWLKDLFPPLTQIGCKAFYTVPVYDDSPPNAESEVSVTLDDLGLQPIDLMYMLNVESEKNLTALDDYILNHVHQTENPRADAEISIRYRELPDGGVLSLFELAAMVQPLRTLTVSARPLRGSDITLQNEASKAQDANSLVDINRIKLPKDTLDPLLSQLKSEILDPLTPLIDPEDLAVTMGNKTAIVGTIDEVSNSLITKLVVLNKYGIPQTGYGYIYDRKGAIYSGIQKQVLEYKNRWLEKLDAYDKLINVQLPGATDDDQRREILQAAERTISTSYSIPVPDISTYQTIVTDKKSDFDIKFGEFEGFLNLSFADIESMVNAVTNLKTNLDTFDTETLDIEQQERQIVVFADEFYDHALKLHILLSENAGKVQDLLDSYDTSTPLEQTNLMQEASIILFGEDFMLIPEFDLDPQQGEELLKSYNAQSQLFDYQINTLKRDFPLDEWLYGVARVREKLGAWETTIHLAEGFKDRPPLDLSAIQIPFIENDNWLGLSFPEDYVIESDKLLYTAYLPAFDPTFQQCGLLVDEWTEVIPAKKETTGLGFHYDQPNNEPPQSMLLVTPATFLGSWDWQHLVNSLGETLDLARLRAIEPDQIEGTEYASFLPATVAASTFSPATIMFDYLWQTKQNLEQ